MSDKTGIEWTDATWNPLVGCSRVSKGCVNCYAERHAYRFARQPGTVYEGTAKLVNGKPTFTGRVNVNARVLDQPLRWKRPRRIFVNSMSDVFHESVDFATIDKIFAVMALASEHVFQVLTKRPARALEYMTALMAGKRCVAQAATEVRGSFIGGLGAAYSFGCTKDSPSFKHPLPNLWVGVSVEDQDAANERIPLLLQTPAAVRFLSCEPLLGPIDLTQFGLMPPCVERPLVDGDVRFVPAGPGRNGVQIRPADWVICGGESGPRARPMHPDWARSLRDQCAAAGVAYFLKQWGEYLPGGIDHDGIRQTWAPDCEHAPPGLEYERVSVVTIGDTDYGRVGKKKAGRTLDGREHSEFPRAA